MHKKPNLPKAGSEGVRDYNLGILRSARKGSFIFVENIPNKPYRGYRLVGSLGYFSQWSSNFFCSDVSCCGPPDPNFDVSINNGLHLVEKKGKIEFKRPDENELLYGHQLSVRLRKKEYAYVGPDSIRVLRKYGKKLAIYYNALRTLPPPLEVRKFSPEENMNIQIALYEKLLNDGVKDIYLGFGETA